jgi:hypothetical protein
VDWGAQWASEGRIQTGSGLSWLNSVSMDPGSLAGADLRPVGSRWLGKYSWGCLRHTAVRMPEDSALPRAVLRLCSLPAGAGLLEMAKKGVPWMVYCSLSPAPKTSKAGKIR